jgi:hypothetical protein
MDSGWLHRSDDPSGAGTDADAASSSAASASSAGGSAASRATRLRKGVRLRLRRRRQEPPTLPARAGGGAAGVQDDLALPLGMSFAAVLAQVRSISTGRQGSRPPATFVPVFFFLHKRLIMLPTRHSYTPEGGAW